MFASVDQSPRFPELEEEVARRWKERGIYQKQLARRADAPRFVFFEGPPTANGMPHPGHCLTRTIKDVFPRYRSMRGWRCDRKAGWDTHGLPVEVEVCKGLGIHSKDEIEAYGVEPFIHRCQASVWRYMQEWERLTERLGFWVNLDEAYVTYHQTYVESVWWALKNLFERGLLYRGHKIVWWWAQGGTALSAGEVGQGYKEVADPSVYVKFPLLDAAGAATDESLLVWTTTPWTLPSNQFAAVRAELDYALVRDAETGEKLVLAADLVPAIAGKVKKELVVERTFKGSELVGRRYVPPFDFYYASQKDAVGQLVGGGSQHLSWRVLAAPFVTTDSGSGVVHLAPAFGEVDFDALVEDQARFAPGVGPQLICAVGPDGKFTAEAGEWQGRWVKEADKDLQRKLKADGVLYHQEQYLHDYPFCWRAPEDPLIQYPRQSWFVRTTQFKEAMIANNRKIGWQPGHIQEGRFGSFLESNVDWALSRERYWGTPLPIWQCEKTGTYEAIGSYAELMKKPGVQGTEVWAAAKAANPELSEDLKVHKPYIDAVTYDSPHAPGARMRRVSEVIDCWFDSGAMPFAQWGWPHQGQDRFQAEFPADFISEAVDQTRGWFYSLLAISTMLFGEDSGDADPAAAVEASKPFPHPFRNCIVLGLMLGEDGKKMSKKDRNYLPPAEIFDKYGADALRWYFVANQPPWSEIRYKEQSIKEAIPEFLLRLWNVYRLFTIYARIDGFDPSQRIAGPAEDLSAKVLARGKGYRPTAERGELDRWILGELDQTLRKMVREMDAYNNFEACGALSKFVDVLSNWYVRRSRDRFWAPTTGDDAKDADKLDGYWTLYECLTTVAKAMAPFTPFLAETLWKNLAADLFNQIGATGEGGDRVCESAHLADYPAETLAPADVQLSQRMAAVLEIVSLGRSARNDAKIKVRQPLGKVEVVLASTEHQGWLETHVDLIADELNVKAVEFAARADQYVSYQVLPDLKKLGPKLGKQLPELKKALASADAAALLRSLDSAGAATLKLASGEVSLGRDELLVRMEAKPGWAAAHSPQAVVVLSTELNDGLLREGLARELVHAIQGLRKEAGCEFTDRISVAIETEAAELPAAVGEFGDYIRSETLADSLQATRAECSTFAEVSIAGAEVRLGLTVAKP